MNNKALVLDLLEWISFRPRPYEEVMAAWRTSCPRLTIWEDALDLGFVTRGFQQGKGVVEIHESGLAFLKAERGDSHAGEFR